MNLLRTEDLLPADWRLNMAIWAVVFGSVFVWHFVTARRGEPDSLGAVVRSARSRWLTRWGMLVFWGWLGWHLFVRTTY